MFYILHLEGDTTILLIADTILAYHSVFNSCSYECCIWYKFVVKAVQYLQNIILHFIHIHHLIIQLQLNPALELYHLGTLCYICTLCRCFGFYL